MMSTRTGKIASSLLLLVVGLSLVPAVIADESEKLDLHEAASFSFAKGDRLHFQYLDKNKNLGWPLEHVFYQCYQKVGSVVALPPAIIPQLQNAQPNVAVETGPLLPFTVLSVLLSKRNGEVIAIVHFHRDGHHISFRGAGSCGMFLGIYQELPNELTPPMSIDSKSLWTAFVSAVETNVPAAAEHRKKVEELLKKYY